MSVILALAFLPTRLAIGSAAARSSSSKTTTLPTGITLSVDWDGSYRIATQAPSWSFAGTVGYRLTDIAVTNGRDSIGGYRETVFSYQATVGRRSGIRVYIEKPVVVFTTTYLATAPNSDPFPILQVHPRLSYHLSHQDTAFGTYLFNGSNAGDSPSLYFDAQAHGFLLSPAANCFTRKGTLLRGGDSFTDPVSGGSYYIVAPVGPSGIAFLGDTGKFVSLGRKRITQLTDDGRVKATVAFADGEQAVTLHGYAEKPPRVEVCEGSAGPLFYDSSSHRFNITLSPRTGREASVLLTARWGPIPKLGDRFRRRNSRE